MLQSRKQAAAEHRARCSPALCNQFLATTLRLTQTRSALTTLERQPEVIAR
ncbi:MAG: hypothetical protein WCH40_00850 [Verrucomicrobiales bacterium]